LKIALIAPPFISVPPKQYGGTELFIAQLASGLKDLGVEVVVYANGESEVPVEVRYLFEKAQWPVKDEFAGLLKDLEHTSWSLADAVESCDLVHINSAPGMAFQRFVSKPMVYTVHHALEEDLALFYKNHPEVQFVTISDFQRTQQELSSAVTIQHGIDTTLYRVGTGPRDYLAFLGRVAPVKGTHIAIRVAKAASIPLKIAGEVQPMYSDYFESEIKPQIDGKFIQYVGEVDLEGKNQLLGGARALLFPIEWDEPFGLVITEAMACGTQVLAFPRGSVPEIVRDGISGTICADEPAMVAAARAAIPDASDVRHYVEQEFSIARMAEAYLSLYKKLIRDRKLRSARSETAVA
jgi:glycosyltransferase involved in cell wall biosynthesis